MPKEKSSRAAKKATSKADGGKKKKGECTTALGARLLRILTAYPDPNMPKRGLSAYMFFANEQRDGVREDNPGIKFGMLALLFPRAGSSLTTLQARLASFSARSGRPSMRSRRPHTRPRLPQIRSATKIRRKRTSM